MNSASRASAEGASINVKSWLFAALRKHATILDDVNVTRTVKRYAVQVRTQTRLIAADESHGQSVTAAARTIFNYAARARMHDCPTLVADEDVSLGIERDAYGVRQECIGAADGGHRRDVPITMCRKDLHAQIPYGIDIGCDPGQFRKAVSGPFCPR